jgi:hypothetical protein
LEEGSWIEYSSGRVRSEFSSSKDGTRHVGHIEKRAPAARQAARLVMNILESMVRKGNKKWQ